MKSGLLLIAVVSILGGASAQTTHLKKDTIFNGKAPYAILKTIRAIPACYSICSFDEKELISVRYSHLCVKEQPLYVVTFRNDHKQAGICKQPGFPLSFVKEIVKFNLITSGSSINMDAELQFINAHNLPAGYTDVDDLIDY